MKSHFWETFHCPEAAYSPMPFWFLNDTFDPAKFAEQIADFEAKGVRGFVLHPRIGIPDDMEYLSDAFMKGLTFCVEEAHRRGMLVILYDEGMYPSGSACGQVAAQNPRYASREIYCTKAKDYIPEAYEEILAVYDVRQTETEPLRYIPSKKEIPPAPGYEKYLIIFGFSHGTIRGLHADQDDGGKNAPPSADLLNEEAVQCFIRLTHERYYAAMKPYFGNTIIGIFTDEPSLLGRGGIRRSAYAWTENFAEELENPDLLPLFFETESSACQKAAYQNALRRHFRHSYYEKISCWCAAHNIRLMGHPAESDDTDFEEFFDVPGQDIVLRWLHPDNALTTVHSLTAKCSADMARQLGRRRNSDEVLGVCGQKDNPWDFRCDEMMWYFNYLLVRGVNLIIPHAFYYSLRTPLQYGERPPDVGPGNLWWPYYRRIAGYLARMCFLNTDSQNHPAAAVLCHDVGMPVAPVKALYENGFDFNYLNFNLLIRDHTFQNGHLLIKNYAYHTLLIDSSFEKNAALSALTEECIRNGVRVYYGDDFFGYLRSIKSPYLQFVPNHPHLRRTHLSKDGYDIFFLMNENDSREETIRGFFETTLIGKIYLLQPFDGTWEVLPAERTDTGLRVSLTIPPYTGKVLLIDTTENPVIGTPPVETCQAVLLPMQALPGTADPRDPVSYQCRISVKKHPFTRYILHTNCVRDMAELTVNDIHAGTFLIHPFEEDITDYLKDGENKLECLVIPSKANTYGHPVPVFIGDCYLITKSRQEQKISL